MTRTGKTLLQDLEVHVLRARVVELEAELSELRADHDALMALVDRIVSFLKAQHGEDTVLLDAVEEAAVDAITP